MIREVADENNVLSDKVENLEDKVGTLEDELEAKDKELKSKDEELKKIKALWQKLQAQVDEMKADEEEMFGDRYKVINKALGKMDPKDLESISNKPKPTNGFLSNCSDPQKSSPKKLRKAKKLKSKPS